MEFLDLFGRFIKYHENTFNYFDKRKKGTINSYYNRFNLVTEFLSEKKMLTINAHDFTIKLAGEFFHWLGAQDKSHNYSVRVVQTSAAVLSYGTAHEFIKHNPLSELQLKKVPPGAIVHLTVEEIYRLQEYKPLGSMYQKARDMFLFQCVTGLDYGDLTTINIHNIVEYQGQEYIIKKRNKTNNEAFIPYFPKAKTIFEKYNYNLRLLCNQKYNEVLKLIAKDLNIAKHLTTHVGRKTYAMFMLNQEQYSLEALSKILGHKKIATTEIYYTTRTIELVHKAVTDHANRQPVE
jgi:integrase/recombinase XerD